MTQPPEGTIADVQAALQQALSLHQAGQLQDAEALYLAILETDPDHADANHLLGLIARRNGNNEAAAELISKAIRADPDKAIYHNNLGNALKDLGRLIEAVASYRTSLDLNPGSAPTLGNLGRTFLTMERFQDAAECHEKAIALTPDDAEAHMDLGLALHELDRLDDALASYDKALSLNPDYAEAHNNRGITLQELGRQEDAIACYQTAIELKPDYSEAHSNLGHLQLLKGDFRNGWNEANWRWRVEEFSSEHRQYDKPVWDGGDIAGKQLLVWSEQGIGDEIVNAGMIPDLSGRGIDVVLESDTRLTPLFARSFPGVACIAKEEAPPAFDYHIPAGGLGQVLRTSLDAFPKPEPYLTADTELRADLRIKYGGKESAPLIGLAWNSTSKAIGRQSSLSLTELRPVLETPGVTFVDLQYGDTAEQRAALTRDTGVKILHDEAVDQMTGLDAFAAQVAAMDLVISIDNSTAYLAGALGVPAWVLLYSAPFWLWGLEREDCLWCPCTRLYRQTARGDWKDVVERVARDLAGYSGR